MSSPLELPLTAAAQTFSTSVAGQEYTFQITWNTTNVCWMINILDTSGNKILSGVPMVTGVDLLEQFEYLNFGFQMYAQTDNDTNAVPTFENMGTTSHLYVVSA